MRLLGARRGEDTTAATADTYLLAFDTWFAELELGEGLISRHQLIDYLLDLRLRLTSIQQLEDNLTDAAVDGDDTGAIPIELPATDDGLQREGSRQ